MHHLKMNCMYMWLVLCVTVHSLLEKGSSICGREEERNWGKRKGKMRKVACDSVFTYVEIVCIQNYVKPQPNSAVTALNYVLVLTGTRPELILLCLQLCIL